MKLFLSTLAIAPFVLALSEPTDRTVTVTNTRFIATCPCDDTITTSWADWKAVEKSTSTMSSTSDAKESPFSTRMTADLSKSISQITKSSTSTILTSTTSVSIASPSATLTSSITTTSSSRSPTTTQTSATSSTTTSTPGTISNPGLTFVPSGQIAANGDSSKRALTTVYIDLTNHNAAKLTTDASKAQSFVISTAGMLSTTINTYYNDCGTSAFGGAPGLFQCSNAGIIYTTYLGWTNSPTFTYQNWVFCYKADMTLYLSQNGPTSDCTLITFTSSFSGTTP